MRAIVHSEIESTPPKKRTKGIINSDDPVYPDDNFAPMPMNDDFGYVAGLEGDMGAMDLCTIHTLVLFVKAETTF